MPYNGSGTFSRLFSWVVDAANNVNISSSRMDAEINGMAAALTNCITRDGQSPPSANLPMGGLKITNLGAATTGTDALNLTTADARYLLASGGTVGGDLTISGNETVTGIASAVGVQVRYNAGISKAIVQFTTADGSAQLGSLETTTGSVFTLNCTSLNVAGVLKQNGNQVWDAVSLTGAALNTIYGYTPTSPTSLTSALSPYAPLASPSLTGTPVAPTAAAGTATTQLATTAFVDALRDVPSNPYTTSQTVGAAHRGQGADFNGTSLTATIASGLSNGFTTVITNLNSTTLTIASAADTLTWAGTTSTGSRTLAQNGVATVRKVNGGLLISGVGLS